MFRGSLGLLLVALLVAPSARADEDDFVAWAQKEMRPIDASGGAFAALGKEIEAARLIGMGESFHETEPFLSFRVQFFQHLVERHEVTALVFESGLAEAMAVDDYVTGRTDVVDLRAGLPGGFGHLQGIRRAIEWIREWNLGPGRERPVHVHGSDVPGRQASLVPALDRLAELTSESPGIRPLLEAVRPLATKIAAPWWRRAQENYEALPAEEKAALRSHVARLVDEVHRLTAGEADRREWTRRVALVIQQAETMHRLGPFSPTTPREIAMAENTMWILGRLKAGERAVYWAHNAHVQRALVTGPALPPGRFKPTGMHLAEALGTKYLAIGTAYGGPSRDAGAAPAAGSVDAAFTRVATVPFLLGLRLPLRPPGVDAWLSEERPMRFQAGHLMLPLDTAFDAIAYFDGTSAAAQVPR